MKGTMDAGESFYTGDDTQIITGGGGIVYGLGFYLLFLLLIFTLCYTSYICKRSITSFGSTIDDNDFVRLPHGLDDDIIATFPTFLYSQTLNLHHNNYGSGCSICLADYRPADVLRLLPECGHFFHVSCIDKWLKVHPTCPVCRNSLDLND